jgi:tetrahydromethanopterin S-methyltransferase subunit D
LLAIIEKEETKTYIGLAALLRVELILVGAIWRYICHRHRVGGASSSKAVKSIIAAGAFRLAAAAAFIAIATLAAVASTSYRFIILVLSLKHLKTGLKYI